MAQTDPDDVADDQEAVDSLDVPPSRDQDAVASLRDTEAEANDEEGVNDVFDLDVREARDLGVKLDGPADDEPRLD